MTDEITIPPEAAEAAFRAWCRVMAAPEVGPAMQEAIAAALAAWPNMEFRCTPNSPLDPAPAIILPLPQEPSND